MDQNQNLIPTAKICTLTLKLLKGQPILILFPLNFLEFLKINNVSIITIITFPHLYYFFYKFECLYKCLNKGVIIILKAENKCYKVIDVKNQ